MAMQTARRLATWTAEWSAMEMVERSAAQYLAMRMVLHWARMLVHYLALTTADWLAMATAQRSATLKAAQWAMQMAEGSALKTAAMWAVVMVQLSAKQNSEKKLAHLLAMLSERQSAVQMDSDWGTRLVGRLEHQWAERLAVGWAVVKAVSSVWKSVSVLGLRWVRPSATRLAKRSVV